MLCHPDRILQSAWTGDDGRGTAADDWFQQGKELCPCPDSGRPGGVQGTAGKAGGAKAPGGRGGRHRQRRGRDNSGGPDEIPAGSTGERDEIQLCVFGGHIENGLRP